jgi:hypothetical protein
MGFQIGQMVEVKKSKRWEDTRQGTYGRIISKNPMEDDMRSTWYKVQVIMFTNRDGTPRIPNTNDYQNPPNSRIINVRRLRRREINWKQVIKRET